MLGRGLACELSTDRKDQPGLGGAGGGQTSTGATAGGGGLVCMGSARGLMGYSIRPCERARSLSRRS